MFPKRYWFRYGKVLFWATVRVLLGIGDGGEARVSIWEFAASPLGLLRWRRLREKLILINHLGRQSQFGT